MRIRICTDGVAVVAGARGTRASPMREKHACWKIIYELWL